MEMLMGIEQLETCLGPCQTSMIEGFNKND